MNVLDLEQPPFGFVHLVLVRDSACTIYKHLNTVSTEFGLGAPLSSYVGEVL